MTKHKVVGNKADSSLNSCSVIYITKILNKVRLDIN